jgi:hypothetical protein
MDIYNTHTQLKARKKYCFTIQGNWAYISDESANDFAKKCTLLYRPPFHSMCAVKPRPDYSGSKSDAVLALSGLLDLWKEQNSTVYLEVSLVLTKNKVYTE